MDNDSRPATLVLSPEAPYPLHGGGALRTASLLQYLSRQGPVDLILFRQAQAADPRAALPPGLVRDAHVIGLPHHGKTAAARVVRNGMRLMRGRPPLLDRFSGFEAEVEAAVRGKRYRLALVEHFWCAPYCDVLSRVSDHTVLDLHNIESALHQSCAAAESSATAFAHRRFHIACRELEKIWLRRYSLLLAASEEDAARARQLSPQSRVSVYKNAIPLAPCQSGGEENVIAFSGNLEYHPNQSAVRFFAGAIWPEIRTRWPDVTWRLIGKNPHAIERFIQSDARIQVTGEVEDAVTELAKARVVVVPLLSGSGTRFKILEAWAARRAVVSTRIGAAGLPARDGVNLALADSPERFCEAISLLLASPELRAKLGREGRTELERNYTWESAWAGLGPLVELLS